MYFNYNGVWTGGHDVVGATCSSSHLLLRGGHLPARLRPLLLHTEPGEHRCQRHPHLHEGRRHHRHRHRNRSPELHAPRCSPGTSSEPETTPPTTSPPRWTCTNGQSIIAERPMYFNYNGVWTGGHDVVGATVSCSHLLLRGRHLPPRLRPLLLHTEPGEHAGQRHPHLHEGRRHHCYRHGNGAHELPSHGDPQEQAGNRERPRPRLLHQGDVHQRPER